MMKKGIWLLLLGVLASTSFSCSERTRRTLADSGQSDSLAVALPAVKPFTRDDIVIVKALLYGQHTLADTFPYRDTVRVFQWDKMREGLFWVDSLQQTPQVWGVLQNRKNIHGEAPLVREFARNSYKRVSDRFGTERYQGIPLYFYGDSVPERYGMDGTLVRVLRKDSLIARIATVYFGGEWEVPSRYLKVIGDTVIYRKVVMVDRTNQNIATLEKGDSAWLVRSMNPATTGVHQPPYAQETPLGLFVIQEKKAKMYYLHDGTSSLAGYAPWASRFSNGGYIHGVPTNDPNGSIIEYSWTLGSTPRSHMCVRNASSHARFVYDWAPTFQSLVFVYD